MEALAERAEYNLTQPSQEIRISCHACGSETPVLIAFHKPSADLPLVENPDQLGLPDFPVQRFPNMSKKAPREIPIRCPACGGFTLSRRKSEPRPDEQAEVRLYSCTCSAKILTKETFWRVSDKSYIEPAQGHEE